VPVGLGGYGITTLNGITEKEVKISEGITGLHAYDNKHSRRREDMLIR